MKIAIRARILFAAAAWLAATSTRAEGPLDRPPLELARYRTASNPVSRLSAAPESAPAAEPVPDSLSSPAINADAEPMP